MNAVDAIRRKLGVLAVAAVAIALLAITVRAASVQNTTRETRERHVFMTVLDKNDAPVTDLTVGDVVVREDGVAREIASVGRATSPMQIVLLADDSQAAMNMPAELKKGLTTFVQQVLTASPGSEIQLMTFGERPTQQSPFTSSLAVLNQAIGNVFPRTGAGAYMLEAIIESTKALAKKEAPRPVIVAFVVEDGPEFSNDDRQMVERALKNAGVTLWTIPLEGRQAASSTAWRERAAVISDVAAASGGGTKAILDKQALERAFSSVATWLTSQVDVTYSRPDRLIPPTKLEVSVKRPELRVSAPRWTGVK
jgi:VWFA-related protein